ncbi:hypothetical protein BT93_L5331, partial [Corymbia citriodora subsp. variegata]
MPPECSLPNQTQVYASEDVWGLPAKKKGKKGKRAVESFEEPLPEKDVPRAGYDLPTDVPLPETPQVEAAEDEWPIEPTKRGKKGKKGRKNAFVAFLEDDRTEKELDEPESVPLPETPQVEYQQTDDQPMEDVHAALNEEGSAHKRQVHTDQDQADSLDRHLSDHPQLSKSAQDQFPDAQKTTMSPVAEALDKIPGGFQQPKGESRSVEADTTDTGMAESSNRDTESLPPPNQVTETAEVEADESFWPLITKEKGSKKAKKITESAKDAPNRSISQRSDHDPTADAVMSSKANATDETSPTLEETPTIHMPGAFVDEDDMTAAAVEIREHGKQPEFGKMSDHVDPSSVALPETPAPGTDERKFQQQDEPSGSQSREVDADTTRTAELDDANPQDEWAMTSKKKSKKVKKSRKSTALMAELEPASIELPQTPAVEAEETEPQQFQEYNDYQDRDEEQEMDAEPQEDVATERDTVTLPVEPVVADDEWAIPTKKSKKNG